MTMLKDLKLRSPLVYKLIDWLYGDQGTTVDGDTESPITEENRENLEQQLSVILSVTSKKFLAEHTTDFDEDNCDVIETLACGDQDNAMAIFYDNEKLPPGVGAWVQYQVDHIANVLIYGDAEDGYDATKNLGDVEDNDLREESDEDDGEDHSDAGISDRERI